MAAAESLATFSRSLTMFDMLMLLVSVMPVMQTSIMVSTTPQMINVGMRKHFRLHILLNSRFADLSFASYRYNCDYRTVCACVCVFVNVQNWHFTILRSVFAYSLLHCTLHACVFGCPRLLDVRRHRRPLLQRLWGLAWAYCEKESRRCAAFAFA